MVDWLVILLFPLIRSVSGWLENAARDGKFEWYEWRRLIETILKIAVPTMFLVIGLDIEEVVASALVTVVVIFIDQVRKAVELRDKAREELKKNNSKKKK